MKSSAITLDVSCVNVSYQDAINNKRLANEVISFQCHGNTKLVNVRRNRFHYLLTICFIYTFRLYELNITFIRFWEP